MLQGKVRGVVVVIEPVDKRVREGEGFDPPFFYILTFLDLLTGLLDQLDLG